MQTIPSNVNPGIIRFLMTVAPRPTETQSTQTPATPCEERSTQTAPAALSEKSTTSTSDISRTQTALVSRCSAAGVCDSELPVYMPWTGLILELIQMKDEEVNGDSTFVSTLSVGELKEMMGNGNRPHCNQRCYQGFITDVRIEVQRSVEFANHQTVSYTPVYKVWLPADGSLFEVSGLSLPSPVKRSTKSSWGNNEVLAMELYGIGESALKHGISGDDFTWIPVFCKTCRTRVCMKKDLNTIKVMYPPSELRTSKDLPQAWQTVRALPPVQDTPQYEELNDPVRSFPHIGNIASADQLAFTPVVFQDVVACNAEVTDEHLALYRLKCNSFLAEMRPVFDLVTSGADPRAHGWTRLAKNTEGGVVYEWIQLHRTNKRKAETVPGQ